MFRKTISLRNFLQRDSMLGSSLFPFCTSLVLNWSRSLEPSPSCNFCRRGRPRRRKQPHRPGRVSGWCEGRGNLPITSIFISERCAGTPPPPGFRRFKTASLELVEFRTVMRVGGIPCENFAFLGQLGWRTGPGRGEPGQRRSRGSGGPRHPRTGPAGDGLYRPLWRLRNLLDGRGSVSNRRL